MAIEADFGVLRIRKAEVAGNAQSPLLAQHRERLAVLILLPPDQVLVLIDMRVSERLHGAVTIVAGTRSDADMHRIDSGRVRLPRRAGRLLRRCGRRHRTGGDQCHRGEGALEPGQPSAPHRPIVRWTLRIAVAKASGRTDASLANEA